MKKIFGLCVSTLIFTVICMLVPLFKDNAEASTLPKYDIKATLDEKNHELIGTETVQYTNKTGDPLNELVFHLFADANRSKDTQSNLFVDQNKSIQKEFPNKKPDDFLGGIDLITIQDANGNTLDYLNQNQSLTVKLDNPLPPGEMVKLTVSYKIKFPFGMQRLSFYNDFYSGVHWYPILSVYDSKKHEWNRVPYSTDLESDFFETSSYDIELNVPSSHTVAITGSQTETTQGNRKVIHAKADKHREVVFFSGPKLKPLSKTKDGLTINFYYIPGSKTKIDAISKSIDLAFDAIQFFNKKVGNYPYSEFDIVETDVQGVAIEYTGVIQLGSVSESFNPKRNMALVHEIGHQWFHGTIGNNSETEAFLDESITSFVTDYYFNEKFGFPYGFGALALQADGASSQYPLCASNNEAKDELFMLYYHIGKNAMYDLYKQVGVEKFDYMMQTYFQENYLKNANINGFLEIIHETLGKNVYEYMNSVLYKPNYSLPKKYLLTQNQKDDIISTQLLDTIKPALKNVPVNCTSQIIIRGFKKERIVLIKGPETNQMHIDDLKSSFKLLKIRTEVINEKNVKMSNLKNANVIYIGNPTKSAFYQKWQKNASIKVDKSGWKGSKYLKNPSLYGFFSMKNPINSERIAITFFWTNSKIKEQTINTIFYNQFYSGFVYPSRFYQAKIMSTNKKIEFESSRSNPNIFN